MDRGDFFKKIFNSEKSQYASFFISEIEKSEHHLFQNLEKISVDFPNLTDHSILHSLMLWNYAELIVGENISLNVLEGYILHMCFLIHDSGMCYSILNNKEELKNTPIFKKFVLLNNGIFDDIENEALFYCVRELHGDFALEIAESKLPTGEFVIVDTDLRDEFAHIIGKISKSHSCDVSYIENELNVYLSPKYIKLPIDCRKLAYILRVCDAADIDNLRTPSTKEHIVKNQIGVSREHWIFQKKMGFPSVENGYLVYRSNSPFSVHESRAWWLCYDALCNLQDEIIKANTFFTICKVANFAVQGVAGVGNPLELGQKYIFTKGWQSLNTNIKVSNPKLLASNVGGNALYGSAYFAVRELLQNSIDAIAIRQLKEENLKGVISIELSEDENGFRLVIKDNGIGMSKNVLVNQLLDFGGSYWKKSTFYDEYIGLTKIDFKSIGKFGIGFYSVFMLGDKVSIKTVKFGGSLKEQCELVFENGLYEDPMLTEVLSDNLLNDYGTEITIFLHENPYKGNGFIKKSNLMANTLANLIKFLIPSCKCQFIVKELGSVVEFRNEIRDFQKYNFGEITDLTYFPRAGDYSVLVDRVKKLDISLIPVEYNGVFYGQLGILPTISKMPTSEFTLILCKGIRVGNLSEQNFIGYLKADDVVNLSRTKYSLCLPFDGLLCWAKRQVEYMKSLTNFNFVEQIKALKFAFGLFEVHDTSYWLYINTIDKTVVEAVDENFITRYLNQNDHFTFYSINNSDNFDKFKYDGFIFRQRSYALTSIVAENEKSRFVTSISFLHRLFKSVWGDFIEEENIGGLNKWGADFEFNHMPYLNKQTFKKLQ